MNLLNRTFAQIRAALNGLSMSQRLLIGLLVVVMIGTIFVVVHFSAKPEMIALLPQPATPAEINTMESYLKGKYTYQIDTDKILVPVEQAYQIRGELAAAQALPRDTTAAFARLADASDYLLPDASIERRWNYARQEVLSRIIRNFPYVADATVIISKGQMVGLGKSAVPSSASVSLRLKMGDGLSASQVLAIVDLVRGAVSGLKREDVHVTDGTRSYTTPNEDQVMPTDLLAYKRSIEDDLGRKLRDQFSHMGDVKIAVNVVPDMSARTIRSETYDPKQIAKATTEEQSKETNSSEGSGAGGQPGVQPNVTANTGSASAGGAKNISTTGDTTTKTEVRFSHKDETQLVPSGTEFKDMTASISLPRSFFRALFRRTAKDDKVEPTDEQLQPIFDGKIKSFQALARNTIGAKTDDQVRVDWFDDTLMAAPEIPVAKPSFLLTAGAGTALGQYAKPVVLGVLAVGALFMMLMMVRRSAPSLAGADADTSVFLGGFGGGGGGSTGGGKHAKRNHADPDAMDVGDDVFGEAGSGEAVLTGIELDDETLQSRKMVDEVSTMIKENPENAASLVKRWMTKGK